MKSTLVAWIGWRLPGLALWMFPLITFAKLVAPDHIDRKWLLLIIYPMAVGILHAVLQGWKSVVRYSAAALFFPFLAPILIGVDCLLVVYHICRIAKILTSMLASIFYFLALMLCIPIMWAYPAAWVFDFAAFAAMFMNYALAVSGIRWAIGPVRPIHQLTCWLAGLYTIHILKRIKSITVHGETGVQTELQHVLRMHKYATPLLRLLKTRVTLFVSSAFIAYFTLLFLIFTITYGTFYYGLSLNVSEHYSYLPSQLDECMMYSISVLTTSPLPGVQPMSKFGRLVYCLELLNTVCLLTLFVTSFSIGLGVDSDLPSQIYRIVFELDERYEKLVRECESDLAVHAASKTDVIIDPIVNSPPPGDPVITKKSRKKAADGTTQAPNKAKKLS